VSVPPACFRVPTSQYSSTIAQFVILLTLLAVAAALHWRAALETVRYGSSGGRGCACRCRRVALSSIVAPAPTAPLPAQHTPGGGIVPMLALRSLKLDEAGEVQAVDPRSQGEGRLRLARRMLFILLGALYGTVTGTVLSTLRCHTVTIAARAYARLDVDGTALRAAGLTDDVALLQACDDFPYQTACNEILRAETLDAKVSVSVLTFNPNAVCWESAHRMAAGLALILLLVYVAGYPVALAWLLRTRLRMQLEAAGLWDAWRAEVGGDARARQQWVAAAGRSTARRCGRRVTAACCWPRLRPRDPATVPLLTNEQLVARGKPAFARTAFGGSSMVLAEGDQAASPRDSASPVLTSPAAARYEAAAQHTAPLVMVAATATATDAAASAVAATPIATALSPRIDVDLPLRGGGGGGGLVADGSAVMLPTSGSAWLPDSPAHEPQPAPPVTLLGAPRLFLDLLPLAHADAILLAPAQGDVRASQLSFHAKGMLLLLAVTAIQVGAGEPGTIAAAALQATALIAVALAMLAHSWLHWPSKREEGLNAYVGYCSLWLAVLQALLNCVAAAVDITSRAGGPVPPSLTGAFLTLSYAATLGALGLVVLVAAAFVDALLASQAPCHSPESMVAESGGAAVVSPRNPVRGWEEPGTGAAPDQPAAALTPSAPPPAAVGDHRTGSGTGTQV
jgi:hypothetical protein